MVSGPATNFSRRPPRGLFLKCQVATTSRSRSSSFSGSFGRFTWPLFRSPNSFCAINVGVPGSWTGEDSYLIRQPRRLELRALVETWVMHLPLDQMAQMTAADPAVIRNFCQNLLHGVDVLIRIIHDLQKQDPDRRIASVLQRMTWSSKQVLLTQTEVGTMASASRRQVNAALKRFAANGWLTTSYGSISVLNAEALRLFGDEDGR